MRLVSQEYILELKADATGKAPAEIELIPREGTITGRDGRTFLHDQPGGIIKEFNQGKVDLPIDLEHSTQLKAPNGEPALAVGWIKKLTMSPYGAVWGAIEWNQKGRELIEAKAYRYISPVFAIESGSKRIIKLISAGLTNKPNLFIPALNSEASVVIPYVTAQPPMTDVELNICRKLNIAPEDYLKANPKR